MSAKWQIIILVGLGLLVHFMFFGHPNQTVFDEVHFGKFVSGYYTHEYFFDIHPPLGKLMIAGFGKLFNFEPGFAFAEIGNKFPDNQYLILRFLPNLSGSLLPLVIFLLLMEMGINRTSSFFGGLFIVFENALLTQSHYILLDSFLLLFGFTALLFYFKLRNYPLLTIRYSLLFGFFSGLAISVKWTGLGFLALPLLIEFVRIIRIKNFKAIFPVLIVPLATALFIYFIIFSIHLIVLNKSGPGDAFMSIGFQKTLIGNQYAENGVEPSGFIQKFIELNVQMYEANQRLDATHPYSSQWYEWPLMTRPIYYWVNGDARIYLVGNPIIWWLSTAAVLVLIVSILYKVFNGQATSYFLLAGYVVNMLPFVGVKRVMFMYHYFTAYIFAILILTWLISRYDSTSPATKKSSTGWSRLTSDKIFGIISVIAVLAFIFFAPLSYGLDLSPKAYEARVWFSSWK